MYAVEAPIILWNAQLGEVACAKVARRKKKRDDLGGRGPDALNQVIHALIQGEGGVAKQIPSSQVVGGLAGARVKGDRVGGHGLRLRSARIGKENYEQ